MRFPSRNTKELAILREAQSTAADPQALALAALGWVLEDTGRAQRFLALTGLSVDALRDGLGDVAVLGAVLDFLAGHEPDLLAAAEALGVLPEDIAQAKGRLNS